MKKAARQMSILMGVTLSFFLSLTGNLTSGHFEVTGFITSFIISLLISLLIGFCVPMNKVTESLDKKLGLKKGSLAARCVESLASDIIYTPVITFAMVTIAYKQAVSHGARLSYPPMLGKAMLISTVVGYVLIFIFMPLFMKLVLKRNGINVKPDNRG